jgi:hypothetical protein
MIVEIVAVRGIYLMEALQSEKKIRQDDANWKLKIQECIDLTHNSYMYGSHQCHRYEQRCRTPKSGPGS